VIWWLAFAAATFVLARLGRFWGIVAAQLLVATVVVVLDVRWIQAEMHRPGWDGQPDEDVVFMIGVLIRVLLINTLLLPVSAIGGLSRRGQKRDQEPTPGGAQ
jgi:hypothetical protein